MKRAIRYFFLFVLVALWGQCPNRIQANTYTWNSNNSGSFTTAANWTDVASPFGHIVPGVNDTALFDRNLNIAYSVTFPGSVALLTRQVKQIRVGKNTVSFADSLSAGQSPATFSIDASNTLLVDSLIVGDTAGQTQAQLDTTLANFSISGATIGKSAGSAGTLNVNGGTLTLNADILNDVEMFVGKSGSGTLNVSGGGKLILAGLFGDSVLGRFVGSSGTALVTGAGSQWNMNQTYVGVEGTGSLSIAAGGTVTSAQGFVGFVTGGASSVSIAGAGSKWTTTNGLGIGQGGTGSLSVTSEGKVVSNLAHIGSEAGSNGTATVDGAGTSWENTGFLGIGYTGTGALTIQNGALVTTDSSFIATDPGSIGNLLITGSGSTWDVDGSPVVGEHGTGTLTIEAGGKVTNSGVAFIGRADGGIGTTIIRGTGSLWSNAGMLSVGGAGKGTLVIESGGKLTSNGGSISSPTGAVSAATVSGAASKWENSGGLGTSGSLTIEAGGVVTINDDASLGGSPTNSVTIVRDAGSSLSVGQFLNVGHIGVGTLRIENGATVTSEFGAVGDLVGGDGAVTVTGSGSTWNSNGALNVGYRSGHGTLLVEAGANAVTGSSANIGSVSASATGVATIRGPGSKLMATGINVGAGGTGTLSIEDGATAESFLATIGFDATSNGTATVTGANSKWTNNNNDFEIGIAGIGKLTVANGGAVQAPNLVIGTQGSVHGNGTLIGIVRNSGLVAPGTSTGSLRVTGSYLQTATGSMQLELAGNAPGTTYDQLLVSHGIMLNGSLQISLVGTFMPAAGANFNLFDGTFFPGTFSTIQLPTLAAGLMWNAAQLYTTGELRVTLQGDYNANGTIDAADYTVWRNSLGQSGTGLAADGNGDHMITRLDFDVWKSHFGQGPGSGASENSSTSSVPEPASILFMLSAVLTLLATRCRV